MITDIFARRYEGIDLHDQYYEQDRRFLNQAAVMIRDPLWLGQLAGDKPSEFVEARLKEVHDLLALELGVEHLSPRFITYTRKWNGNDVTNSYTYSYADICKNFLIKTPDDTSKPSGSFVMDRLSLIELAFRRRWDDIQQANRELETNIQKAEEADASRPRAGIRLPGKLGDGMRAFNTKMNVAFDSSVRDLNERLRLANYKLSFHNGMIQFIDDEVSGREVGKAFWSLVASHPWENVDQQMKEALDRRDRGDRTAAFHAVCALESAIKIISDSKGWTSGNEKGAANYIDNLVSSRNGRYIEIWESEMLKAMFSDVRNPFAHGPGQAPMAQLSPTQANWAIDTAMVWIKSLVSRF